MELIKLQSDPSEFRQKLLIDTDAGPTPFAQVIEDWQDHDFRALDDGSIRAVVGLSHPTQGEWLKVVKLWKNRVARLRPRQTPEDVKEPSEPPAVA